MFTRQILTLALEGFCATVLAGGEAGAHYFEQWNRHLDQHLVTGDGRDHGPNIGSAEWQGAVEFKLGIRGQAGLPVRGSDGCQLIDRLVRER